MENEDEDQRKARLHQIRVEAGKKAAATRRAHAKEQVSLHVTPFILNSL